MNQDYEIAKSIPMRPIDEIASSIGIKQEDLEHYGPYKAKITSSLYQKIKERTDGKLILVTAINPTSAGEGKSTTTIGLADGLKQIRKNVVGTLREPSLGPVFGLKGGATGGGYSQVAPMDEINLHFTGDMHAITTANNLIAAVLDNSLYQGNPLEIDPNRIIFTRCLDMNDRTLRDITIGQGKKINGIERQDHFEITVATEMMAILCLSSDEEDFKQRVGSMVVAYNVHGEEITVDDLGVTGAVEVVMKDALKPNLVQSLEHTPFLVHGGPFANIAHGCNSIIATKLALKLGDYVVTEAGFGADLGAEKFLDIKCRTANLKPNAVVLVATIRALKMHGGIPQEELNESHVEEMLKGCENLEKHVETLEAFHLPFVIAINRFTSDHEEEISALKKYCYEKKWPVAICEGYTKGGKGMLDLANVVVQICEQPSEFEPIYDLDQSIQSKIETIAKVVYGAKEVAYSDLALEKIKQLEELGEDEIPICMAKTPMSLSDDGSLKNRPRDFVLHVQDVKIRKGAGFLVVYTGSILTMPGLPKDPAALHMGIDENGDIYGLF